MWVGASSERGRSTTTHLEQRGLATHAAEMQNGERKPFPLTYSLYEHSV